MRELDALRFFLRSIGLPRCRETAKHTNGVTQAYRSNQLLIGASMLASACLATSVNAESLGYGRLFVNDYLGDGHDRWRSGSYVVSQILGQPGSTGLPGSAWEMLEIRFRSEIIAPRQLDGHGPFDRAYAGEISLGVHTHFKQGQMEYSLGADIVAVGKATGVSSFQRFVHEALLGQNIKGFAPELGNALYTTFLGEMAMPITISGQSRVRPFVEAEAGVETFVRAGLDIEFGGYCAGEVRIRDVSTGFRYRASAPCAETGLVSSVIGVDVTKVFGSKLLPSVRGVEPKQIRARARIGVQFDSPETSVFYGFTWLSKEFEGQTDNQLIGAINVNLRF